MKSRRITSTGILVASVLLGGMTLVSQVAIGQDAIKVARSKEKANRKPPQAGKNPDPIAVSGPRKPKVILSAGHRATCVKFVGDSIGDPTVRDINNTQHKLKKLLSNKFTVLIFWNDNSRAGVEQFRRIPVDILGTYAKQRVKVIAANTGGDLATTKRLTGNAAKMIDSLVDGDQELFGQFANSRVPRTYLLDKDGKILWFDIEYSQGMQRELENALDYYLNQK